jgi:PAS domain S-box-containing protein
LKEGLLRGVKSFLSIEERPYKTALFRVLVIFVYITIALQYISQIIWVSFSTQNTGTRDPLLFDPLGLLTMVVGALIFFSLIKKKFLDVTSHLLMLLFILLAIRAYYTTGEWYISAILLTLTISISGQLLSPTYSLLYGVFSFIAILLFGYGEISSAQVFNLFLLFTAISFVSFFMSRIISQMYEQRQKKNERLAREINERKRVENLLLKSNDELKLLNSVGETLSETLNLDTVLQTVLLQIRDILDVYSTSIWLNDHEREVNICKHVAGPGKDKVVLEGFELNEGTGLVGKVVQNGISIITDDAERSSDHYKQITDKIEFKVRSILTVPLVINEKVIGAIQLVHGEIDSFSEQDQFLIESIASMASKSIENARLHQALKDQLSEVKRVGIALKESDNKFKILAESTTTGILLIREAKIIYLNPAIEQITGYSGGEILNTPFINFVHQDDKARILKELRSGSAMMNLRFQDEFKYSRKNGTEGWADVTADIVELEGVPTVICTMVDITKYKLSKQKLEKTTQLARESFKAKEEFLASISHEIRTPLNAIVGMSELITRTEDQEDLSKYIGVLKTSTENLLIIINDLLDFSKIEAGKLEIRSDQFNIENTLDDIKQMFEFRTDKKGLDFNVSIRDDIPRMFWGDEYRIKQILMNLIDNAIKFTDKGSITLTICNINLNYERSVLETSFCVIDTGIGIKNEQQNRIFDSFEQVSNKEGGRRSGIGLGLPIVRSLTELLGGTLKLESEYGEGSKFIVTLPLIVSDEQPIISNSVAEMLTSSKELSLKDIKILLIEDNEVNQMVAENLLGNAGAVVAIASDGLSGLNLVEKDKYDIVLLDIELPDIDGYEVAHKIRSECNEPTCDIPIIALTAHAIPEVKRKVLSVGIDDYVTKPFNSDLLIEKIFDLVSRSPNSSADLTYLRSATNDDREIMKEMIHQFFIQMDEVLIELDLAKESKDLELIRSKAHQIKPSITYMGIRRLKSIVESLESEAKINGDFDTIISLLDETKRIYLLSKPELEKFVNSDNSRTRS